MITTPTTISEVKVIEPAVFADNRGCFYESFNQNKFQKLVQSDITFCPGQPF
jgi:dTDP-4-dehydrorhamnose 3,5-epimerase